jgi:Ca-activated chloride channel family protein
MRKLLLLLVFSACLIQLGCGQTKIITGKVKDEKGNPLPNVSVLIKGTTVGVITDSAGVFAIKLDPAKNKKIVFSFVGYQSKEVAVGNKVSLEVSLSTAGQDLEEVVVTGYGIQKRSKQVSYSQTTIRADAILSYPSLQGKVAGVNSNGYYGSSNKNGKWAGNINDLNTEEYDHITENIFHAVTDDPLSTFSIDVDAASYSNIRRYLNNNELPPADAVRIEEMINYFHYDYPQPLDQAPFSINTEISNCPWNSKHKLVMIGLQGKKIPMKDLPPSNLVFLIDVSGSMDDPMKLPLVQSSMKMLADQLREQDKISIVVYAGNAGLVLPATSGLNKIKIKEAIDNLEAGGSTAGGEGIRLAYKIAKENFMREGNNRIILCTDGDFNVGASSNGELERLVEQERESGVFLTVLGYGMGNYKDSKMEVLADKGNGNHAYIDGEAEAKKVLVTEFGGTLFTIAKDVKLQIEFNPATVAGYRLIGYENRLLNKEDFNDDRKDAGELGSGHTVTALYEIIPAGVKDEFLKDVDPLKYQAKAKRGQASNSNELVTVKFRYKEPEGNKSSMIQAVVTDKEAEFENASANFRQAAAVAEFGLLLHNSEFKSAASFEHVVRTAKNINCNDAEGYWKEFIVLVKKAEELKKNEKDLTKK